jgi:hypothetical protein
VTDLMVEQAGFELSVPLRRFRVIFEEETGPEVISEVPKDAVFFSGGPAVRITFAPAESLVRTWLSGAGRKIALSSAGGGSRR